MTNHAMLFSDAMARALTFTVHRQNIDQGGTP